MTTTTVERRDPAQCEKDHLLWLEEIEQWRGDHRRALETLEEVAAFVRRHDGELEEHLADIERHREQTRAGEVAPEVEARHQQVRERHLRLRGRHRGLMDEITKLAVRLHRAAHGRIL